MTPIRVQLSRRNGWRMPENTVKVSRPGYWGNPFAASVFGRDAAVRLYRALIDGRWGGSTFAGLDDQSVMVASELRQQWLCRFKGEHPSEAARSVLRGKNLACWCPLVDKDGNRVPCHADVLLAIANA